MAWQEWPIASKIINNSRIIILFKTKASTTSKINQRKTVKAWVKHNSSRCLSQVSSMLKENQISKLECHWHSNLSKTKVTSQKS